MKRLKLKANSNSNSNTTFGNIAITTRHLVTNMISWCSIIQNVPHCEKKIIWQ